VLSFSRGQIWAVGLGSAVIILSHVLPLPARYFWGEALENSVHIYLFILLGYLLCAKVTKIYPQSNRGPWRRFLATCIGLSCAGLVLETLQLFSSRAFEIADLYNDMVGTATGAVLRLWFEARQNERKRRRHLYAAALLLLCSIVLMRSMPLIKATVLLVQREMLFPVLVDFSRYQPAELIAAKGGAQYRLDEPDTTISGVQTVVVLELVADSGNQRFVIQNLYPAWCNKEKIVLELFVARQVNPPESILVEINDQKHNRHILDRYSGMFALETGFNAFEIDLQEVFSAPLGRSMDCAHMHFLQLIVPRAPVVTSEIEIHKVYLY